MSNVEIINKYLEGSEKDGIKQGFNDAWLIKFRNNFYVVSSTIIPFIGKQECLIFKSDKNGYVSDWREFAGGYNTTHEEAIKELEEGVVDE